MSSLPAIETFTSSSGAQIYRIPVEAFPGGFIAYCYLVLNAGVPTLIDTGSGMGASNDDLLAGLAAVGDMFGERTTLTDIQRILVTHGHIDHFGGVSFMQEKTGAIIGIHELDRRVLTAYEERVIIATKDLSIYLERAGVKDETRQNLMEMYGFAKRHVKSVNVDLTLTDEMEVDGMIFYHTPGHCSGQVCILIGDILISADHVLARITPHQAPESITHYTGLGHYLEALKKIGRVPGVRLAMGGHETPIEDFYARVEAIRVSHENKIGRVLDAMRAAGEPLDISHISRAMYPDKHGYEVLLAIEEVGAHVEYLYDRGYLAVANLDEVNAQDNPVLRYSPI